MSIAKGEPVLFSVGFGLTKTATSLAYMTAMGSVTSSIGFVSELDFMLAMNLAACVTGFGIVWLVRAGKLIAGRLSQTPALVAFVGGFLLNALHLLAGLPPAFSAKLLGALCGFSATIICACWLEVFAAQSKAQSAVYQIVGALLIQGVLVSLLPLVSGAVVTIASILLFLVSGAMLKTARRTIPIYESPVSLEHPPPHFEIPSVSILHMFVCTCWGCGHLTYLCSRFFFGAHRWRCEHVDPACSCNSDYGDSCFRNCPTARSNDRV